MTKNATLEWVTTVCV